jgi:TonB-linked SusC/RagA family outer membrane protein
MFVVLLQVSANSYSQTTKLSLTGKNLPLEKVFEMIEDQSEFSFLYNLKQVDLRKQVDIDFQNEQVEKILDQILKGTNITYTLNNRLIIIHSEGEHYSQVVLVGNQQESVSGKVADSSGAPLPGVTVVIKGTTNGTVTNADGEYSLSNIPANATLQFSFVGMKTTEVLVGSQAIVNVVLEEETIGIEEVVAVGYGSLRRRDVTGSVTSVQSKQFEDEPMTSIAQGMQGKIAGVNITSGSGAPGGNMIVRIRGNTSVLGSNDPLFVIDGFPVQSGTSGSTNILSTINPSDIESMEVLKDASATAIYGSRGSNGVILITTKQGSKGQQNIQFETSFGFRKVEKQLDMMNSSQWLELANEWHTNDGKPAYFSDSEINTLSQTNTNWQNEIFRTALIQDHTISFNGGNDKTRYLISGSYFDEEGIIRASEFQRGSLRINLDQEITSRFTASGRISLSRSVNNQVSESSVILYALQAPPILGVYNEDGSYVNAASLKPYPFSPSSGDNPVALAEEQLNRRRFDRVLANISGDYKITEGLNLKISLGVDALNGKYDVYNPRTIESGLPAGSGSRTMAATTSFLNENILTFNKDLRENDHLNVVAGITWQQEQNESMSSSASGFVTDDLENNILGSGEIYASPGIGYSDWTLLSYLARINYSLNDKYLLTLSGRTDGSSRFGEGNKWGFFPSGALAWRLSEEEFIKTIKQISNLRARVSWGVSGNQAISPYQSLQQFSATSITLADAKVTGFAPNNLGNPDLKWETTREFNAGLEVGLWDNWVSFTADCYIKNTEDLLALVNLPPTAGFTTTIQNIGSTQNKGFEFNISTDIFRSEKFAWDIDLNVATNQNKVTKTAGGQDIIAPTLNILGSANIVREGEPLASFFGLETDGLTEDGYFKYVDQNDDEVINDKDRVILGDPYADCYYGFSTNLVYGNFSLRASFQGEYGKELWNNNRYYHMSSMHRGNNQIADVAFNRWTPENPNANAPYPRASATLNQQPSDWFIEDASYLRLQNVRLMYNIPVSKFNVKGFKSASVFVSGQNLFTLTGYSWYTPDINAFSSGDLRIGIDQNAYPSSRTFMLGLKLGF